MMMRNMLHSCRRAGGRPSVGIHTCRFVFVCFCLVWRIWLPVCWFCLEESIQKSVVLIVFSLLCLSTLWIVCLFGFDTRMLSQMLWTSHAVRSVTTLQETLYAQVPEKLKKMNELKKEHGDQVYVSKQRTTNEQLLVESHTERTTAVFGFMVIWYNALFLIVFLFRLFAWTLSALLLSQD